jgi:hypothetical protein
LNRSTLAARSIGYIDKYQFGRTPSFTNLQNLWSKDLAVPIDLETAHADFQSQLEKAKESTVLLSHENLLGPAFSGKGLYREAEILIGRLQQLAHPHRLRIIVCLRNQVDFFESLLVWRLMLGTDVNLPKYLAKVRSARRASWLDLLIRLEGVVGCDGLLVLPFELVYDGNQHFLKAFLSLSGVDIEGDLILAENQNSSHSEAALRIQMLAAQLLDKQDLHVLRVFLQGHFPARKYGRARMFDDALRLELRHRFSEDNRTLLERFVDRRFITDRIRSFYCE